MPDEGWVDALGPDEELAQLRRQVTRLQARLRQVILALAGAPRVPRWPRTPYSKWWYGERAQAVTGRRDELADAMDLAGRPLRPEEVYGCCERHPKPPLGPALGDATPTSILPHFQ